MYVETRCLISLESGYKNVSRMCLESIDFIFSADKKRKDTRPVDQSSDKKDNVARYPFIKYLCDFST